jgi:hypothetical protein
MENQIKLCKIGISIFVAATFTPLIPTTLGALRYQEQSKSAQEPQNAKKKVHFKVTLAGEVRDEDGTHLSVTAFETPEGVKLTMTHHRFDSALESESYLKKQLARATKIVGLTQKKDNSGKIYGERAELIVSFPGGSDSSLFGIVWTSGPEFHEIVSKSMSDNLELERQTPN